MGSHPLSILITIGFFVFMAYLIYQSRQKRAEYRSRRAYREIDWEANPSASEKPGEIMATFKHNLEQLKAMTTSGEDQDPTPQAHVVEILKTIYIKLEDLDDRIRKFEIEAEEFKKSHIGLENP